MPNSQPLLNFLGQVTLTAKIKVLSGLHIGAGKEAIEIGGIDQPVVKLPSGEPYVPGSSLKGKLRFLLEWSFGKINPNGKPWGSHEEELKDLEDPILRIFGTASNNNSCSSGPTRLLIRDAIPSSDNSKNLTEEKVEISMDRIKGKAADKGLRKIERVSQGTSFKFEASFRLYEVNGDKGKRDLECLAWLIQGFDLLEQDALGGSGSRGYGQVKFSDLKLKISGLQTDKSEEVKKYQDKLDKSELGKIFRGKLFSPEIPPGEIMEILNDTISPILTKSSE